MKRIVSTVLTLVVLLVLVMPAIATVAPRTAPEPSGAETESVLPATTDELPELVVDETTPRYTSGLCIEPSPCETSAECGYTLEGYPGVCLPNFGYPEIDSDKVCICP